MSLVHESLFLGTSRSVANIVLAIHLQVLQLVTVQLANLYSHVAS